MPIMNTCLGVSLETASIISGVFGLVIVIVTMVILLTTKGNIRSFLRDKISPAGVKIITSLDLVLTVLIFIFLIVGVVKRNKFFVIPWMITCAASIILQLITYIYSSVDYFMDKEPVFGALVLLACVVVVALEIYLWLGVVSFFQVLSEEDDN